MTATLRYVLARAILFTGCSATPIPLLSPDGLTRCNGKVPDLRGRLRHNARLNGLTLP